MITYRALGLSVLLLTQGVMMAGQDDWLKLEKVDAEADSAKKQKDYEELASSSQDEGVRLQASARLAMIHDNKQAIDDSIPYWRALESQNKSPVMRAVACSKIGNYYMQGWLARTGGKVNPDEKKGAAYLQIAAEMAAKIIATNQQAISSGERQLLATLLKVQSTN